MLALLEEERARPHPLPNERVRLFRLGTCNVDDGACVQAESSYCSAAPAPLSIEVVVRAFENEILAIASRTRIVPYRLCTLQ